MGLFDDIYTEFKNAKKDDKLNIIAQLNILAQQLECELESEEKEETK